MKKLYAIRDKETGNIIPEEEGIPWVAMLWNDKRWAQVNKDIFHNSSNSEIVTLRIEPTEPCILCRKGGELFVNEYEIRLTIIECQGSINIGFPEPTVITKYALLVEDQLGSNSNYIPVLTCPNCGRSLK